jgi:hypothetical protein
MVSRDFLAGGRGRERDEFDAAAEAETHGIARDEVLAIWARVRREATDPGAAKRQFDHEARAAAKTRRDRTTPGRRTLVDHEAAAKKARPDGPAWHIITGFPVP